jgi:hypothetical protein
MRNFVHTMTVPNLPDTVVISLRLKVAEAVRYQHVLDAAFKRNPYIDKSHAIRELIGLAAPALLTVEEIDFFRTGKRKQEESTLGARIAPETTHPLPIRRNSPVAKKRTG